MRADAIRYFILSFYGGIYLDLDDVCPAPLPSLYRVWLTDGLLAMQGCRRRLDPLLSYHAWLRKTVPTGISNDAMGSVPKHPFFLRVIDNLQRYNRNWQIPYVTVMYNTGPLFLSVVWKEYLPSATTEEARVRILMPDEYGDKPWRFFGVYRGNSWHRNDAKAIFWMGQHWMLVTFLGFALAGSLYTCGFLVYRRLHLRHAGPYGARPADAANAAGFWPWSRFAYKRLVKHEV